MPCATLLTIAVISTAPASRDREFSKKFIAISPEELPAIILQIKGF